MYAYVRLRMRCLTILRSPMVGRLRAGPVDDGAASPLEDDAG